MEFYSFNAHYVQRLQIGDVETENHFADYFSNVLYSKLRSGPLPRDLIEDIQQETILRVLIALRTKGMRQPERLGAFVNSFCDRVKLEVLRRAMRDNPMTSQMEEPADPHNDPDVACVVAETQRIVRLVLEGLPQTDRDILWSLYIEELTREEVSVLYQIDIGYIRVLLFRAKDRFREAYLKAAPPLRPTLRSLRERAKNGSPSAQTQLGVYCLEGIRVKRDPKKALGLFKKAAASGFAPAQFQLGKMIEQGVEGPRNIGEAVRLYSAAAEEGEFLAQVALGRMYSNGAEGLPADPRLAKRWYEAAADQEDLFEGSPELDEAKKYLSGVTSPEG